MSPAFFYVSTLLSLVQGGGEFFLLYPLTLVEVSSHPLTLAGCCGRKEVGFSVGYSAVLQLVPRLDAAWMLLGCYLGAAWMLL